MNILQLTGYFNNVREIGEKTKIANFSYTIKNKEKKFENVFIEVFFSKDLIINEKIRYIIDGFFVGSTWIDKKTKKKKNISKIRINSITPLKEKTDYRNNFKIYGSIINIKKISDNISIGQLSYSIKTKDNKTEYIYIETIFSNNMEIKEKIFYNFSGFFTGKVWENSHTKKIRKKIQLYCSSFT